VSSTYTNEVVDILEGFVCEECFVYLTLHFPVVILLMKTFAQLILKRISKIY
jgi:hypothetical protein